MTYIKIALYQPTQPILRTRFWVRPHAQLFVDFLVFLLNFVSADPSILFVFLFVC